MEGMRKPLLKSPTRMADPTDRPLGSRGTPLRTRCTWPRRTPPCTRSRPARGPPPAGCRPRSCTAIGWVSFVPVQFIKWFCQMTSRPQPFAVLKLKWKPVPDADGAECVAVACRAGLGVEPGDPGRTVVPLLAQLAVHPSRVALREIMCAQRRLVSPSPKVWLKMSFVKQS